MIAYLTFDDFLFSYGYAFMAASYLSGDLKKFHDMIEDVIAQADEVDDRFLQVSKFIGLLLLMTCPTLTSGWFRLVLDRPVLSVWRTGAECPSLGA